MFGGGILDIAIEFYIAISASLIVGFVFLGMSYGYTQKRANQRYAKGKDKAPSLNSFRILSKVLFVSSMLVTIVSYWFAWPFLLLIYSSYFATAIGAVLVLVGYCGLRQSFVKLGNNYSPLFDAFIPFELVTKGIYSRIRHPIYLFNLFVSFGLALSSGSALVFFNGAIGLCFILWTIHIEENYLRQRFSHYSLYCDRTWRLVPYCF